MKIPDEVLRQYFELATDIPTQEIDEIMSGDIRDAHVRFAKELIYMYDNEEDIIFHFSRTYNRRIIGSNSAKTKE